jgi:protein subunit release factor A
MHASISSLEGNSQLSDDLKMKLVLSSEQEIEQISKEASRLIELQSYIDTPQISAQDLQKLRKIEENHANDVEKALVLHSRVQQTLKIYQEMISFSTFYLSCMYPLSFLC